MGAEILRAVGNEDDPNWSDVRGRDVSNYLRERHWIRQWSGKRWPSPGFISMNRKKELRLADLGRTLDDPGDAFFDLGMSSRHVDALVTVRTWVEVTEVFLPGQAPKVNSFIRDYNGLRGKGGIDASEFLESLDLGLPDAPIQRDMAEHVVAAVKSKARKGREGGSYRPLVDDYGRGALIVGLPLWFAVVPTAPMEPSSVVDDFASRLLLGLQAIERTVLRREWCPFDSVVVLWNPTLESIDSWAKAADHAFYSNPANVTWHKPISILRVHSLSEAVNQTAKDLDEPAPQSRFHVRWDRYSSVDAVVADQRRRFRRRHEPRPFGPKAQLQIVRMESRTGPRNRVFRLGLWLIQLRIFLWLHGRHGLRLWLRKRTSPIQIYTRWRIRKRLKELCGDGLAGCV